MSREKREGDGENKKGEDKWNERSTEEEREEGVMSKEKVQEKIT